MGITRLYPPLKRQKMHRVVVNKEFICFGFEEDSEVDFEYSPKLLLHTKDFVLNGRVETPILAHSIMIRGTVIIAIMGPSIFGCSIQFWRFKDTDNVETSPTHFKSIFISEENEMESLFRPYNLELGLSHNFDTFAVAYVLRSYYDTKKIAQFDIEPSIHSMGCMDMLAHSILRYPKPNILTMRKRRKL